MNVWKDLALRLVVGIGAAALIVLFDGVLSFRVEPILALLAGAVVAAASWAIKYRAPAGKPIEWQQPSWHAGSPHLQADPRTRRLASALANAQPGRGFEARGIASHLALLTARRLVTSGRVPRPTDDEDALAYAEPHLSASLLAYLRSAATDHPQVINRKTLDAHLKEIESL